MAVRTESRTQNEAPLDSRSGIALIIVIGFLSVLAILGIGFAITMRTERLVSRYSAHDVNAGQFIQVALGQALDAVDTLYAGQPAFPQSHVGSDGTPTWDAPADWPAALATMQRHFLQNSPFSNQVPLAVRPSNAQLQGVRWSPVVRGSDGLIGRVAWLAVDLSGLLDANHIGVITSGWQRAIIIDDALLTEFSNPAMFTSRRNQAPGLRTAIPHLHDVAAITHLGGQPLANVYLNAPTRHLSPFAYAPLGYFANNSVSNSIVVSNTVAAIQANRAMLEAALSRLGIGAALDSARTVDGLLDYMDTDRRPRRLDSWITESIPLINEFRVVNTITGDAMLGFENRLECRVELFYPWVKPNPNNYVIRVEMTSTDGDTRTAVSPPQTAPWSTGYRPPIALNLPAIPIADPTPSLGYNFTVRLQESGVDVCVARFYVGRNVLVNVGPGGPTTYGFEARDPRFTWMEGSSEAGFSQHWVGASGGGSLGSANSVLISEWDVEKEPYSRDDGLLDSIAEMRFLPFSADPALVGRTLQQETRFWPLLDAVSLLGLERGLVNPNSTNSNVLASLFVGQARQEYPGAPGFSYSGAAVFSHGEATAIAEVIVDGRTYVNRSDLARYITNFPAAVPASLKNVPPGSSLDGDVIAQRRLLAALDPAWEILSPRQNLLALFLAAEVGQRDGNDFVPQAERPAVAFVWRDPYTGDSFTRFFRWEERHDE